MISAESILNELPQTQCTRCGYPDCAAYARAIAELEAPINLCPPGGEEGIQRLSAITGQPLIGLNPEHGFEGPRHIAWIDEDWCIGCTLCIDACPADAIIGTHKHMHTVIEKECTGCELCIPVCPVDCIQLEETDPLLTGWSAWSREQAERARLRYEQKKSRIEKRQVSAPAVTEAFKTNRVQEALARAKIQNQSHQLE